MANRLTFLFDTLSTASVSLIRAVGAAAGFAFAAIVSSALGPADAGVFFVSITWAFVIAIIARWGQATVIMIDFAQMAHGWRRNAVPAMLRNILRYSVTRVFALALPVLLAGWLLENYGIIRPIGIDPIFVFLLALIVTVQQLMAATAKATGRPVFASALEFCFVAIFAIIGYFLLRDITPTSPMQLFEMLYLAGALFSVLMLLLNVGDRFFRTRWLKAKATRASSGRAQAFATAELAGYLTPFASFLLMPFVLTAHDVGIFNGVLRIASIVQLVSASIPSVFVPRYAVAYKFRNLDEAARLVRSMKIVMLVTGIGFFIAVAVLGRFALQQFGPQFEIGYVPLLICSAGLSAALALGPVSSLMTVHGKEKLVSRVTLASGALSIILSVPAMYFFGINGAAGITGLLAFGYKAALLYADKRTSP